MSNKVEIRCPNGHWVAIKISPNTKILQILEEACLKQGFQPASDYELMHGKKPLDVTLSVRFAGIPNLAKLELIKSTSTRAESNVVIALQVPTGERVQTEFDPGTTIWNILLHWENQPDGQYKGKLTVCSEAGHHPVCIYTREEVIGQFAMEQTTLRSLGLVRGKAMLRLVHRHVKQETLDMIQNKIQQERSRQEKITAKVAEKQATENILDHTKSKTTSYDPDKSSDPQSSCDVNTEVVRDDRRNRTSELLCGGNTSSDSGNNGTKPRLPRNLTEPSTSQSASASLPDVVSRQHVNKALQSSSNETRLTPEQEALARSLAQAIRPDMLQPHRDPERLERRKQKRIERQQNQPVVMISRNQFADFKFPEATKGQNLYENELSSVDREEFKPCDRETVIYSLLHEDAGASPEPMETEELPDDFFEVTESDVRNLWTDNQRKIKCDEENQLMTKSMRLAAKEARMDKYERVVIRLSFPEKLIVQGLFRTRETVHAVHKFVKEFLEDKSQDFYLYTTPPKCVLKDRSSTLIEADLAPMSVVYVGSDKPADSYLSPAVISEVASELEAYKVLVKYMPKKSMSSDSPSTSQQPRPGTSTRTGNRAAMGLTSGKVPKWFKIGRK